MSLIKKLLSINLITLYLNLKYFRFRDAIKFPILIFGRTSIHSLKGNILYTGKISTGVITIGKSQVGIFDKRHRTVFNILGTLVFEGKTNIGRGSAISIGENSILKLGNNFTISGKSSIICSGEKNIVFGNNNLLSWDVLVMNTDFHKIIDEATDTVLNMPKDIIIGDDVWIGCNTKILKGSTIADKCIIGANSIVSSSASDSNSIYVGSPIRKIKENVSWRK